MDSGTVIVFVLILVATAFLVWVERNSRRNEAKLKAESAAKTGPDQPAGKPVDAAMGQKPNGEKSS
jgi:hypothetical protein